MFKGNRKYYYILAFIFVGVIVMQYFQPKPINWKRTYGKNDKIPFGCYAIFNLIENTFSKSVQVNKQDFYNLNEQAKDANQTLLIINNQVSLSKLELISLFNFLEKGNTVLLCAGDFSKTLTDTFKLQLDVNNNYSNSNLDSLLKKPSFEIKYTQTKNNILEKYSYPTVANESYFSSIDTSLFSICAVNKKNKPVLLEAEIGKGRLILASLPDVFGNLFIVNNPNRNYTYTLLSKVKNKTIIWDEYYKDYNKEKKGLFSFIFSSDAIYMAYCTALLGLIFFMAFEIKRKQKPIEVIAPLQNSTLEFVDVISHVYFNSNNHKHIAEETIKYFYFDITRKFHLSTNTIDETFYSVMHNLSGVSHEKIKALFSYCESLKHAPALAQYDLIELNDRISNFKQQSIR